MNYYLIKPKSTKIVINAGSMFEKTLDEATWKSTEEYSVGDKVVIPIGRGLFIGTITNKIDEPKLSYIRNVIDSIEDFRLPALYDEIKYSNAIEDIKVSKEELVELYLKEVNKLNEKTGLF